MRDDYRAPFVHSVRDGIYVMYGHVAGRWPYGRPGWRWWVVPETYPAHAAMTLASGWAWTKVGALLAGRRARRRALRERRSA